MKLNFSKKILIVSILAFFLILALDIFFCRALIKKIISINDKVRQIEVSSAERERSATLTVSIANTQTERENLEKYFVPTDGVISLIESLETLANSLGIKMNISFVGYEPIKGVSADTLEFVRFKMNLIGSWENLVHYVSLIEKLPYVISVDGATLDAASSVVNKNGQAWSLDLDFSVAKIKN